MRTSFLAVAAAAASLFALAVADPVGAITRGGRLDGEDHPYVGLMVADDADGNPMWRCSGALISPTVYVTAGHCTFGAAGAELWFTSDLHNGEPGTPTAPEYNYPFEGEAHGTPIAHPEYVDEAFFLFDLGVVILDEPYELDEYATLPELGRVDEFTSGRNKGTSTVTAVGYGLQKIVGTAQGQGQDFVLDDKTRYAADLMVSNSKGVAGLGSIFKQIDGTGSFIVSGDAKHGGTCFGDSGGPMLADGNVIVGVNSFGLNGNCAGIGGVYRIDQPDDLDFINGFLLELS
ncbi:MAG: trypsin-like serine protease [Ilumatobacter sp.]|uniref:trypsin-like serine protease n=1 Tax=Ilumatobacter sp. TaxID=1967498 RepID=UPI002632773B|nr:trypsin-like serine protease [Ilumatobacter sp.]MDJ0768690.1 trypsin-like serine protease [Ilumatobacter sp.]